MRKEGVVHMPSSLGCRVSHSFVLTVETIAFIKNKYKSPVILYHAVSLLLDIGKNTSARRHVGRRPSWSTSHSCRTPRETHSGCRAVVLLMSRQITGPTLPTVKLLGRRNHHDFIEFHFLKKTPTRFSLILFLISSRKPRPASAIVLLSQRRKGERINGVDSGQGPVLQPRN